MEEIKIVIYRDKTTGKISSVQDYTDRNETLEHLQTISKEWNENPKNDRTTEILDGNNNIIEAIRFVLRQDKAVYEFDQSDEVKGMRDRLQEIENLADDISSLCRRSF